MKSITNYGQSLKVLIVDDDFESSLLIESILINENFNHVGTVSTLSELVLQYDIYKPDLIISNINIEGKSVFTILLQEQFLIVPILFIADIVDEDGFKLGNNHPKSMFVAKPFIKHTLLTSINLLLNAYPPHLNKCYVEVISKNLQVLKVSCDDIVFIEADGNYTFIHTVQKKVYVRKRTLKKVKSEINQNFLQINKSQLINVNFIRRLILGKGILILNDKEIRIGRAYRHELDDFLQSGRD